MKNDTFNFKILISLRLYGNLLYLYHNLLHVFKFNIFGTIIGDFTLIVYIIFVQMFHRVITIVKLYPSLVIVHCEIIINFQNVVNLKILKNISSFL